MALINKIREKTGLAVGVIAFGLILFLVGGDILGPNSVLLGRNDNSVGEIAGQSVGIEDFNNKISQLPPGIPPGQLPFYRDQIWEQMVREISYGEKIEDLGIGLPDNELEEIIRGNYVSPIIRQNFSDPQTRQFDVENVNNFLRNYDNFAPEQRNAWNTLQGQVASGRQIEKYQNMILKTNYVSNAEAKLDFKAKNGTASVSYVYIPYLSTPDTEVSVSDSEISAYINSHADEFKVDASRNISYIVYEVKPSAADSATAKKEITDLLTGLQSTTNDSLYALRNSDALTPFRTVGREDMPEEIKASEEIVIGQTFGPYLKGNKYVLYKVAQLSDKFSARASHILIKPDDDTDEAKAAAKSKASKILRDIRNGADFAEQASIHGTDGTKSKGGDLGWFSEGAMVPEFNDAVMGASKTGLIRNPVESQFGYHIVDVTETKIRNSYKIAQIEKEIYASDETINQFYRKSENFAAKATNFDSFKENAEEEGLTIKEKKQLGQNESRIDNLNNARALVAWAFRDASVGDVSTVFDIDDKYVVAVVNSAQEKGVAKPETVRTEVERKLINKKKAEFIKGKLQGASGSLEDIASGYGEGAKVLSMDGLKLSANSLNSVGAAPDVIGLAFALNEGEKTTPIASDNGVVIIQLDSKTEAVLPSDLTFSKDQILQSRSVRLPGMVDNTVKELANVSDKRYKFF